MSFIVGIFLSAAFNIALYKIPTTPEYIDEHYVIIKEATCIKWKAKVTHTIKKVGKSKPVKCPTTIIGHDDNNRSKLKSKLNNQ